MIYTFLVIFVNWAKFCLQSCGSPVEGCHKIIILTVWLSQTKCTCTCVLSLGLLMAPSIRGNLELFQVSPFPGPLPVDSNLKVIE